MAGWNNDFERDLQEKLKNTDTSDPYPGSLKSATRAEYVTRVRTNRKPGCRLMGDIVAIVAVVLFVIGWIVQL